MSIATSLSAKMNRRIFATIIGIALCVTYLAGTIAMVGGLHETTSSLAASFDQGPVLVYSDADFAKSRVGSELLPGNGTGYVGFCFANVTLANQAGKSLDNVYAVSVYDPQDTLGLNMTNESTGTDVWMGQDLVRMLDDVSIDAEADNNFMLRNGNLTAGIVVTTIYSQSAIFPDDWLLVPRQTMDRLRPELAGDYSFLMLVDPDIQEDLRPFEEAGLDSTATAGVVSFFEEGIYQVERGLWGIVLISGAMTTVLVYCIISIETEYSAPTIRILRGIGANREHVVRVFMLKALFITFVGGVLGTALGFCAANAITSVSSLLKVVSFISPVASFDSIVLPILISLASGLIGGFWPALKASKMFAQRRD